MSHGSRSLSPSLRYLHVDDNPDDCFLALRLLNREFPNPDATLVHTPRELDQALAAGPYDLVITDYHLGWGDGVAILRAVKARYPACPVIMFTGTGSEEVAVEAMKAGLDDYVIKTPKHAIRLPAAIRSALERAAVSRQASLLETRMHSLLNQLNVGVYRATLDGRLLEGNPAFLRLLGIPSLERASPIYLAGFLADPGDAPQLLERLRGKEPSAPFEVLMRRADMNPVWVSFSATVVTDPPSEGG